jgi:hypothetical protein
MGLEREKGKAFIIEIFDRKPAIDRKKLLDRPAPKYDTMEIAASPRAKNRPAPLLGYYLLAPPCASIGFLVFFGLSLFQNNS